MGLISNGIHFRPLTHTHTYTLFFLRITIPAGFPGGSGDSLPAKWETWVQSLGWKDPWKKEWQPTPVYLPGEFQGQKSLVSYSPWGCTESNMTELLTHTHTTSGVKMGLPGGSVDKESA